MERDAKGDNVNRASKLEEIDALRTRLGELEREVSTLSGRDVWTPPQFYAAYEMMGGMVLGLIAAAASLLLNIVGAAMLGKHPLELIRVYLTFPLGESALTLEHGFALAAGVCLYLGTGMFGGIPIHMILSRYFKTASFGTRFVVATILGVGVWVVNYYGIIAWAQPALIGGNWIVERIPILVAVLTHVVFAWTIFLLSRWGQFVPQNTRTAALVAHGGGN